MSEDTIETLPPMSCPRCKKENLFTFPEPNPNRPRMILSKDSANYACSCGFQAMLLLDTQRWDKIDMKFSRDPRKLFAQKKPKEGE